MRNIYDLSENYSRKDRLTPAALPPISFMSVKSETKSTSKLKTFYNKAMKWMRDGKVQVSNFINEIKMRGDDCDEEFKDKVEPNHQYHLKFRPLEPLLPSDNKQLRSFSENLNKPPSFYNTTPDENPVQMKSISMNEEKRVVEGANCRDISSPLIKQEWKNDANLVVNGQYSKLKSTQFSKKYIPLTIIGQGTFGFVIRGRRIRDDRLVAIKFILRSNINSKSWTFDFELGMVPNEVSILKNLSHPGIVQFFECFDDGKYVYLVTELHGTSWSLANPLLNDQKNPGLKAKRSISFGNTATTEEEHPFDLFECIEAHDRLPERTIHYMFKQLYSVVLYLNSQGLVHRDLKDENVVVDSEYRIKIIDFGSAAMLPRNGSTGEEGWFEKFNGTLAFAPPEVIRGLKYRGSETETWALGILLFTMTFKQTPFLDSHSILHGLLDFSFEEESLGNIQKTRLTSYHN